MKNNDFKDVVFNRHSVKEFDKNYKIDREEMIQILEEATKAPSSVNLYALSSNLIPNKMIALQL